MITLQKCLHCGGEGEFRTTIKDDGSRSGASYNSIRCQECACGTAELYEGTLEELAVDWNRNFSLDIQNKTVNIQP